MTESIPSPFDLTGRLAVVTGARRGIGRAIAAALARAGADVVGVSARQESAGSDVDADVVGAGRRFIPFQADLGERREVLDLAARLGELDRPVDILVNNAGAIRRSPAVDHSDADWDDLMSVNLTTPFLLARELGRGMVERGSGRVIFTASLLSFQGGVNVAGYTTSKSGLVGLTRALSNEWAGSGVCVNAIAPGYIATDNTRALRADSQRNQAILDRIPAGRWGDAQDIGGAAVFLASAASSYVSGIVLPVDGGWLGR